MKKKMLFHYPGPLHSEGNTGEKIRPLRMLKAFRELGYEVEELCGDYPERAARINAVSTHLKDFAFLYSESSSLPLSLANSGKCPLILGVDAQLFLMAKSSGLPAGVFYRDMYWRYASFSREVGVLKHLASLPFYLWELMLYRRCGTLMFVPSSEFAEALPITKHAMTFPLPPGCEPRNAARETGGPGPLRLLYIGSIAPPVYDIRQVTAFLSGRSGFEFDIVTRKADWDKFGGDLQKGPNIKVHHVSGSCLDELYSKADLFLMCFVKSQYRKICMPLKLFEALGCGLPVLSSGDNSVSSFISVTGAGWAVSGLEEAGSLLERLASDKQLLKEAQWRTSTIGVEHSWLKRASTAERILLEISSRAK